MLQEGDNGEPLTPIANMCLSGDLQKVQLLSSHSADRGSVDPDWPPEDDLEPPLSSAEQCSLLKACAPDASWATPLVLVRSGGGMLPETGLAHSWPSCY